MKTGLMPMAALLLSSVAASAAQAPVLNDPTKVKDLAIVDYAEATGVTLTWTAPDSAIYNEPPVPAVSYLVRWSTVPITVSNWNDPSVLALANTLVPAEPGTQEWLMAPVPIVHGQIRYVALRAVYADGYAGALSNVPSILPDLVAPAAVGDLRVSGESDAALTIEFTEGGDNDGTHVPAAVASIELRYSPSPITNDSEFAMAAKVAGVDVLGIGGLHTHVVSDLQPGAPYHFAVRSWDTPNVPNKAANASALATVSASTTGSPAIGGGSSSPKCGGSATGGAGLALLFTAAFILPRRSA